MPAQSHAPTLWGIIFFKLFKGLFFLSIALGIYSLIDTNIPKDFRALLEFLNLDPEKKFWVETARNLQAVTPKNLLWIASGTFLYSLFSLLQFVGLMFRQPWASWLAISESAFFIPIEIFELGHQVSIRYSLGLMVILCLNVIIVSYLFRNRHRLFDHSSEKPAAKRPAGKS